MKKGVRWYLPCTVSGKICESTNEHLYSVLISGNDNVSPEKATKQCGFH